MVHCNEPRNVFRQARPYDPIVGSRRFRNLNINDIPRHKRGSRPGELGTTVGASRTDTGLACICAALLAIKITRASIALVLIHAVASGHAIGHADASVALHIKILLAVHIALTWHSAGTSIYAAIGRRTTAIDIGAVSLACAGYTRGLWPGDTGSS